MSDLVQYYLVDRSLSMRQGKACAQCAHGALLADRGYRDRNAFSAADAMHAIEDGGSSVSAFLDRMQDADTEYGQYKLWRDGGMRKIVLRADSSLLQKAMDDFEFAVEVIDDGHTEVDPGTRTVVVLPVMRKNEVPSWIGELKLL